MWTPVELSFLDPPHALMRLRVQDGYTVELTNLVEVFSQRVEDFSAQAETFGIEDLTAERAETLLARLSEAFSGCKVEKKERGVVLTPKTEFKWAFHLEKLSDREASAFFGQMAKESMLNQAYMGRAMGHLKRVVAAKDSYIKFLYENFRLSHGSEAIDRYSENHAEDRAYLGRFSEEEWKKDLEGVMARERVSEWELVKAAARDSVWDAKKEVGGETDIEDSEEGFYVSVKRRKMQHRAERDVAP